MSQIKTHLPSIQFLCAGITAVLCLIASFGTTIAQEIASDSLRVLEAATKASRRDGNGWTRLGYAYLGVNEFEQAERAFKKGIQYAKSPQAHNGLGLVYMQRPQERRQAFLCFRRALGIDPTFIEAQMNIARLHMQLGEMDAENAFKKAIEMDAGYAPAYFELANWYAEHEYEDRIADTFKQYLALRPDDVEGHYGLTLAHVEKKHYAPVLGISELMMEAHPDDARWLALAAQARAARGDADRALDLFRIYFWSIPESERVFYDDLSLVASLQELAAYKTTPPEEREVFLEAFWRKRDITLVWEGKARQVEHYRRVWYARRHFADRVQPWDLRGVVYIKYGEPDYRSRSGHINPFPSPAVQAVKEKIIREIGGVAFRHKRPEEIPEWNDVPALRMSTAIEPVFPIERDPTGGSFFPWESWIYTNIEGGLEFVFTDRFMNGMWNFPTPPMAGPLSVILYHRLLRLSRICGEHVDLSA